MLSFPKDTYGGHILENAPVGTPVTLSEQIRPTNDSTRKLKYEIIGGDGKSFFHVISNSSENGMVQLLATKEMDRESKKEYHLIVKAYDLLGVDSAITKFIITVDDENDNNPLFEQNLYRWAIPTNTTRFSSVGQVHATDADGDHVSYRLVTKNPTFVIVPQTGEVLLISTPLDQSYQLEVTAHDVRKPTRFASQPATILIEVGSPEYLESMLAQSENDEGVVVVILDEDESDSDTEFDGEEYGRQRGPAYHRISKRRVTRAVRPTLRKEFTEAEGQPEGRVIFMLTKDEEYETFKIREENPWVTVEPSGAVRVKKRWDYEELGPEKTIDFWVTITNAGVPTGK